jgi:hypothetical protein
MCFAQICVPARPCVCAQAWARVVRAPAAPNRSSPDPRPSFDENPLPGDFELPINEEVLIPLASALRAGSLTTRRRDEVRGAGSEGG